MMHLSSSYKHQVCINNCVTYLFVSNIVYPVKVTTGWVVMVLKFQTLQYPGKHLMISLEGKKYKIVT